MSANTISQVIWLMTERNKYALEHPQRAFLQRMIDELVLSAAA